MTITRQNTNSPRENRLVLQATKTLAVTGSSLGIGWIISRLWNGSESVPQTESLNQSVTAISQQSPLQNAISSSVACGFGLVLGGTASIATHNPLPLAIGALSCLPSVAAAPATCEATGGSPSQIALSEFTPEAQTFLQNFLSICEYYENMNIRLLKAYTIQCEMIVVQPEIITPEDFKSFIEDGLEYARVYNSKKIVCVSPSPTPPPPTPPPAPPAVPSIAFGAEKWKKYFGDVETEPPLPSNIEEILNGPCPIWPNQKVKDTHILALVPQTVNGAPLSFMLLGKLGQAPKWGERSLQCKIEDCNMGFSPKYHQGSRPAPASHWVLITRQTLPHSTHKTYQQQVQYVADLSQMIKVSYEVPHLLDAATSGLVEYISTGSLKSDGNWIRVQEQAGQRRLLFSIFHIQEAERRYDGNDIRCSVPCFGGDHADWHLGTVAVRKFT